MSQKFLVSIDLNKNELQNAVIHPLATAPSNPAYGQIYLNSVDHIVYQYKGSTLGWEPIGEVNLITKIKVNGTEQTITNKAVDIAVPVASTSTPEMDGTGAAGSATTFAKGDHVHPTDTTRAPLASPAFTGTPTAPTASVGTDTTQIATTAFVIAQIAALGNAMIFKGVVNANTDLPASHTAGWVYKVATAGTYAGVACEVGDTIVCLTTGTEASNNDWYVLQANIDGAVTGPASSTSGHIPTFNGTSGKVLQDGYGVATSITDDSTAIPTAAAVYAALGSAGSGVSVATGTIGTSATSASVSFSGTVLGAFATMSGAIVMVDISIGSSSVTFTTASAPSATVTCVVIYQ